MAAVNVILFKIIKMAMVDNIINSAISKSM